MRSTERLDSFLILVKLFDTLSRRLFWGHSVNGAFGIVRASLARPIPLIAPGSELPLRDRSPLAGANLRCLSLTRAEVHLTLKDGARDGSASFGTGLRASPPLE